MNSALSNRSAVIAVSAAVAAAGLSWWWLRRSEQSVPKAMTGGTLAEHPRTYAYLLEHIDETEEERALRLAVQGQPRAGMMGSPDESAFLRWLLQTLGAKRVIEVGVFRGTTTLQLAKGVGAGGEVVGLDISGAWLDAGGRAAWQASGVADRIKFVEGPAVASLRGLLADGGAGQYDLCFIDADKPNYGEYYELCLALVKTGGIVAIDNTLWHGKLQPLVAGDEESAVIHALNQRIRADARVSAVMLGMADGLYLARKL